MAQDRELQILLSHQTKKKKRNKKIIVLYWTVIASTEGIILLPPRRFGPPCGLVVDDELLGLLLLEISRWFDCTSVEFDGSWVFFILKS